VLGQLPAQLPILLLQRLEALFGRSRGLVVVVLVVEDQAVEVFFTLGLVTLRDNLATVPAVDVIP
jgi:hypothetical protein